MEVHYANWIRENVRDSADGLCAEWSWTMQRDFPELTLVYGHVVLVGGFVDPHFWLEDEDGNVVDPTAAQYDGEIVSYEHEDYPSADEFCFEFARTKKFAKIIGRTK